MRYTPDEKKRFVGQSGYGYRSIENFVNAAREVNSGLSTAEDFDSELATLSKTLLTAAVLEAGFLSGQNGGRPFRIHYKETGDDGAEESDVWFLPTKITAEEY